MRPEYSTEQEISDLQELIELMEQGGIRYQWARLHLTVSEWWHHKGFEYFWMLVAVVFFAALLVWGNNIGASRMEEAMTCPYDDQVRTSQGVCLNPERYVDDYLDYIGGS